MKVPHVLSSFVATAVVCVAGAAVAARLPSGMVTRRLATITNDRDKTVSYLDLMLSAQGVVKGLYLQTSADSNSAPPESSGQVYWLQQIESRDGVVLGQGKGVKAILLQGTIEPTGGHGSLVIRYLTNGVFKRYAACPVTLRREPDGNWELINVDDGHAFDQIHVRTWMLGISSLTHICNADES